MLKLNKKYHLSAWVLVGLSAMQVEDCIHSDALYSFCHWRIYMPYCFLGKVTTESDAIVSISTLRMRSFFISSNTGNMLKQARVKSLSSF